MIHLLHGNSMCTKLLTYCTVLYTSTKMMMQLPLLHDTQLLLHFGQQVIVPQQHGRVK